MPQLRKWQAEAQTKCLKWLVEKREHRQFLINAAPGAGKTIAACSIAARLIEMGEIDRVIVIAPRVEIVKQWGRDFKEVTGRHMGRAISADDYELDDDVCATWAAVQSLSDAFHLACQESRVLVICDEHHHAAVEAAWGEGANAAFESAKYVLILTGTPVRSDGKNSIWMEFEDGKMSFPEEGSYTLSYGEAVDLAYCRPATFHRHEGKFTVDLKNGEKVSVSSNSSSTLTDEMKKIPGLQRALNFYLLACTPQYEPGTKTPNPEGYQGTMVEWATAKLRDLRYRMPNAGGLVIAPSIQIAEYFVDLIEKMEGEKPVLVHSQLQNADGRIESFRHSNKKWIVSVAMISEGVDIPRLRVLIYLPNSQTELSFRQAIGRVVRTAGPDDDTRAYVVMPSFEIFNEFARRIEAEMSPAQRKDPGAPKHKRCPSCESECPLGAKECEVCGHEFPPPTARYKTCGDCGAMNTMLAKSCQNCGAEFGTEFMITLDEALRAGAIVRGMDLDEDEVQVGEAMADETREFVLKSGDAAIVKMFRSLPEESLGRLAHFFQNLKDKDKEK